MQVAFGDPEPEAEDDSDDSEDDRGGCERILVLDALDTEEESVFDVIIAAQSNCSGGGVGSHGHERPKDQIYFGHHEYAEQVID